VVGAGARALFPALPPAPAVYLDSATTTPLAAPVIAAVNEHLLRPPGNAGRGGHPGSAEATALLRQARRTVAAFLGAAPERVFFTAGATHAHSLAAQLYVDLVGSGDEILYSRTDHASAVRPWLRLAERRGARATSYRIGADGRPDVADLAARIDARTRLVCLTHIHQIFGARVDVGDLTATKPGGPLWLVDASQSVGHLPVDVGELGADILLFSGHKMFAMPGVGVLYLSDRALEAIPERAVEEIEPGTVNLPGIVSLAAAVDFVCGLDPAAIGAHSAALTTRLADGLRRITGVHLTPGPAAGAAAGQQVPDGTSLISFQVVGTSADSAGGEVPVLSLTAVPDGGQGVSTSAGGSLTNGIITLAGGTGLGAGTSGDYVDLSAEDVAAADPQVIVAVSGLSDQTSDELVAAIEASPLLAQTTAVRTGNIVAVPQTILLSPSVLNTEAVAAIADGIAAARSAG